MFGFHGGYLRVDLCRGTAEHRPLPEAILRRYLGGVGLGSYLLHREAPPDVDPLAPEAPLVFAFSPLVGTALTTSAKFAIVAKSPLTGLLCDALSSSHFAIAGKRMGVDALVFVGRCAEPSDWVAGELRPTASWGRSAAETEAALRDAGWVAAIGVAGENQVRFATISNEGRHAGRGGLGAVMGAKRLKAVVVRGIRETSVAHPERVRELARSLAAAARGPATAKYRELGTAGNLLTFDRVAALPTRNFQRSQFAGAEALSAEALASTHVRARKSCASCAIGCEHRYARNGDAPTRVEYENLFALGPLLEIGDPAAVLRASRRCDELGLDTISAGGTLAFAMECRERGLLAEGPRFGDAAGVLQCLDAIAHRRGLGDRLAEGSRRLAQELGAGTLSFAPQVKGLELPGYEPRALQTLALGFAVGTRGADHNRSGAYELDFSDRVDRLHGTSAAARLAVEPEDRAALLDSLILCKFLRGALGDLYADAAELLRAVTGWEFDADELRRLARRVVAVRKAYNIDAGWRPEDDTLPDRFLEDELPTGPVAGTRLPRERLAEMVRAYYQARGWGDDGRLPDTVMRDLGLEASGRRAEESR